MRPGRTAKCGTSRAVVLVVAFGALIVSWGCSGRSRGVLEQSPGRGGAGSSSKPDAGTSGVTPGQGGLAGVDSGQGGIAGSLNSGGSGTSGTSGSASGGIDSAGASGDGGAGGQGAAGQGAAGQGAAGQGAAGNGGGAAGTGGIGELVGALDGRLIHIAANDAPLTDDGFTYGYFYDDTHVTCSGGRLDMHVDHPIAGVPGSTYLVTLHFYGVLEAKNYGPDVERESGSTRPNNLDEGADPAPWAVGQPGVSIPVSGYNTYEVRVFDEAMQEVGVYFVNSDTEEGHYTYVLDYERTIPVVGGGVVRLASFDSNCRMMKNCGNPSEAPCGPKARTVDVSAADPPPPPDFDQPYFGYSPDWPGQWWFIDVTAVEPAIRPAG